MFADRYLTKDELFAAGAVFTLIAWGFAFLYSICQLLVPQSFQNPNHVADYQTWLDLLFISFSLQSATGLSDLIPVAPAARVISMLQMSGPVWCMSSLSDARKSPFKKLTANDERFALAA
jgi:heme A synthase